MFTLFLKFHRRILNSDQLFPDLFIFCFHQAHLLFIFTELHLQSWIFIIFLWTFHSHPIVLLSQSLFPLFSFPNLNIEQPNLLSKLKHLFLINLLINNPIFFNNLGFNFLKFPTLRNSQILKFLPQHPIVILRLKNTFRDILNKLNVIDLHKPLNDIRNNLLCSYSIQSAFQIFFNAFSLKLLKLSSNVFFLLHLLFKFNNILSQCLQ